MLKEFNQFVLRGNVVDLAVAEPTTKECPHCFTTIPIQAARCPPCTSEL